MEQKVLPIKVSNVLHQVQRCLREDFKACRRNGTAPCQVDTLNNKN